MDHRTGADLGAEKPQVKIVEGPAKLGHGRAPDETLDHPETEVAQAPDRYRFLLPFPDQQPFRRYRQCAEKDSFPEDFVFQLTETEKTEVEGWRAEDNLKD
jgi:hypothetical protein